MATDKPTKAEYARLSEHFTLKTGSSLAMEGSDGAIEAYALLGQLLEKAGTGIAIAILKKALGL